MGIERKRQLMIFALIGILLIGMIPVGMAAADDEYVPPQEVIRVGINSEDYCYSLTPSVELTNSGGLLIGAYNQDWEFVTDDDTVYDTLVIKAEVGEVLTCDAEGNTIGIGDGVAIAPAEGGVTTYKLPGAQYGDGSLSQFTYKGGFMFTASGNSVKGVNLVGIEDYVKGVIPYEMGASWPLTALEAQALCARTYAVYVMSSEKYAGDGFDIANTTSAQVYKGTAWASDTSNQAVDNTAGQYILYDGEPINAVYHAADGGATESAANVWESEVPYLTGVEDPYEEVPEEINWSQTYTEEELINLMRAADSSFTLTQVTDVHIVETELGNVYSVTFVDGLGNEKAYYRSDCRVTVLSALAGGKYNSQRFDIVKAEASIFDEDDEEIGVDRTYTVTNYGSGHNMGLSQYGAKSLAELGWTSEEIIAFYYDGVTINGKAAELPVSFTDVSSDDWFYDSVKYVVNRGLMNGTSETEFAPDTYITRGMFVTILGRMAGVDESQYAPTGTIGNSDNGANMRLGPSTVSHEIVSTLANGTVVRLLDRVPDEDGDDFIWYKVEADGGEGYVREDLIILSDSTYADVEPGSYYAGYVEWGASTEIVQGYDDGTFQPGDTLSRQDMCTLLYRYCTYTGTDLELDTGLAGFPDLDSVDDYAVEAVTAMRQASVIQGMDDGNFAPQETSQRAHVAEMLANFHQNYS